MPVLNRLVIRTHRGGETAPRKQGAVSDRVHQLIVRPVPAEPAASRQPLAGGTRRAWRRPGRTPPLRPSPGPTGVFVSSAGPWQGLRGRSARGLTAGTAAGDKARGRARSRRSSRPRSAHVPPARSATRAVAHRDKRGRWQAVAPPSVSRDHDPTGQAEVFGDSLPDGAFGAQPPDPGILSAGTETFPRPAAAFPGDLLRARLSIAFLFSISMNNNTVRT
jgi:hypothetical protein